MNKTRAAIYKEYATVIFLVITVIFFSIFASGFLSMSNVMNVLRQVSIIGICSVGMMLVILTGGIDLSVGSVIGVTGTLAAYLMVKADMNMYAAVAVGLLAAILIGAINGFCVTMLSIPPLITTLATMTGGRGICYIITGGISIYGFPKSFSPLGQGYLWIIPIPVLCMLAVLLLGWCLLTKRPYGTYLYSIGGNAEAARLCGINVNKTLILTYILNGIFAGFAGIVLLSRINTGPAALGDGYEMDVITSVVLGGVSVSGGEGKLKGVVCGVLIMGILSNGLLIMGISEYYQMVVKCCVLLLAVGFDKNVGKLKHKA
ncbi:ABC transporter permease [Diplocloster hominis]|uniref:ABC transporter permease n=1 Tax=Diplocloster hominis TaxID=3079010 RepID=UPI0031BBA6EA